MEKDDIQHNRFDSLLQRLRQEVEANFQNEQFSVEQLADNIGMSRSQLHRKLKKLTGQSANQFIREYRLERAMELLQKEEMIASEIAFEVGFGSHSYFASCFTEHYGFPPGEAKYKGHEIPTSGGFSGPQGDHKSRQLAAIMFTDIVGYTALMGEDEEKAFEVLKRNRQIQRPIIEKYHGKWLKEIGDGVLASFSTVTDAVHCAKEIQESCLKEDDLNLRIGIHQGEVVFDGNDVFGDGVNIASRLEPLAPIGGIMVSESVNRDLGNKKGIETKFVGEKTLKNVKEPVKIFQVKVKQEETFKPETTAVASSNQIEVSGQMPSTQKKIIFGAIVIIMLLFGYIFYNNISSEEQVAEHASEQEMIDHSIAVIPFKTITKDSTSQYIADGVREAILNTLYKIKELQVGSRTSSEIYRNSPKRVPEIASELGVANILEGSAQKFGDRIRITVQLIDGKTDNHLWSEEYDRDWGDIFAIYSEIAEKVATALQVVITPEVKQQIAIFPTTDVTAYDYSLQAYQELWKYWDGGDTIALNKAAILYSKVLELDSTYALGWAYKILIYMDRHAMTEYFEKNYLDSVLWYCDKAIALDPNNALVYSYKANVFLVRGNIEQAIKNYQKTLDLIQNDDINRIKNFGALWRLGYIYIYQKDYIKGFSLIKKAVQSAKGWPQDYRQMLIRLGRAYQYIGAYKEAKDYFINAENLGGSCFILCNSYFNQGDFRASIDCLATCGQTNSPFYNHNYLLANAYLQIREFETSMKYFRKAREKEDKLSQFNNLYREGFALIQMGNQEEGMKLIEEQLAQLDKRKTLRRPDGYDYHYAAIYAALGDQERAMQYLRDYQEKVFDPPERIFPISYTQHDIMFENLWENEEFKAIVRRDHEEKASARAQIREMEERGK